MKIARAVGRVRDLWSERTEFSWTKLISEHIKIGQGIQALRIYKEMREEGMIPSTYTFVAALKACTALANLEVGKEIHAHVIESGNQSQVYVATTLVDMYVKCGSMIDARQVFDMMPHRDVVSWNAMIIGYAQMEKGEFGLQLYARMQHEGFIPNNRTFVAALNACSCLAVEEDKQVNCGTVKRGYLEKGRAIHSQVVMGGSESDIFVANALMGMYVKCGSMVDAHEVFEQMVYRNVVSWNTMIIGYAQMEKGDLALQFYARMQHDGFIPNDHIFVSALKACSSLAVQEEGKEVDGEIIKIGCLEKGRAIHSQAAKSEFESSVFVATALMDMYIKCGSMVDARQVFEKMPHRDVVSWNTMIIGYAQMEKGDPALKLYARMQHEGFTPNDRTFVAALKACGSLAAGEEGKEVDGELIKIGCLEKGRSIHFQVAKGDFESSIFITNALVDMYVKCGSMVDACQVFENMPHWDLVSWNSMIMGYAQMEKGGLALQLYVRMQHEGFTPDNYSFVAALKACCSLVAQESKEVDDELMKVRCLERGRAIHSQFAKSGFELDIFVGNALVAMYMKCGSMVDACDVFEKMVHRNVMSWNAMIAGYAQMEKGDSALQLYSRMQHEGFTPDYHTFVAALKACGNLAAQGDDIVKIGLLEKGKAIHYQVAKSGLESNIFVANTLVDMYAKCGSMVDACMVFDRMLFRTVVSWNAMIMGYAQMEMGELALQLYARMQHEGIMPDDRTFVAVLKACGSLTSLEIGKEIHAEICRVGLEGEAFVATCLVDMYGKCGCMVDAQRLFDALPVRGVVIWSALIAGYSSQGDSEHVFDLFDRMQQEGIRPVGITFISVLTVCSHRGLVHKGHKYFQTMCIDHGIIPQMEHYTCMVDLLGRAGQLDEAVAMVKKMPFEPVIVTWMTILGACQKWNNAEIGRLVFECVVRLDGECPAAYVLMMNISVSSSLLAEVLKSRN